MVSQWWERVYNGLYVDDDSVQISCKVFWLRWYLNGKNEYIIVWMSMVIAYKKAVSHFSLNSISAVGQVVWIMKLDCEGVKLIFTRRENGAPSIIVCIRHGYQVFTHAGWSSSVPRRCYIIHCAIGSNTEAFQRFLEWIMGSYVSLSLSLSFTFTDAHSRCPVILATPSCPLNVLQP